jgi:hypothetical protein
MWKLIPTAFLVMTLASACVSTGANDTFCLTHSPTRLSVATINTLTDAQAKKILADNEYGAKLCDWKRGQGRVK